HHEHQHDDGELDELLAGRRDDLAQFADHLTQEQRDATEEAELLVTQGVRSCCDDIAANVVLIHRASTFRESACALTRRADRNRTCNLRFWRPLLCQLSYRPRDRMASGSASRRSGEGTVNDADNCPSSVRHPIPPAEPSRLPRESHRPVAASEQLPPVRPGQVE